MENQKKRSLGKSILYWSQVTTLGIILGVAVQFAHSWTEPAVAPPGGNIGAPINTGSHSQVKAGNLALNSDGTRANGLLVVEGNVGIGNLNPQHKLEVSGKITSFSTEDSDPGTTVVTKDYVDAQSDGGEVGHGTNAAICYVTCAPNLDASCDSPYTRIFLHTANNVTGDKVITLGSNINGQVSHTDGSRSGEIIVTISTFDSIWSNNPASGDSIYYDKYYGDEGSCAICCQ